MHFFYMDASALVKRYVNEVGTPLMNHFFGQVYSDRIKLLNIGIAEVVAVLTRKRNSGQLAPAAFGQALINFGAEVIGVPSIEKLQLDDTLIKDALLLIPLHSLNATDAILLRSALNLAIVFRAAGNDLVLVASDQRLLKAAQAEGLRTFDPESQTQAELDQLIGQ